MFRALRKARTICPQGIAVVGPVAGSATRGGTVAPGDASEPLDISVSGDQPPIII